MSEEPSRKRLRITPRTSLANNDELDKETPNTQLRQLANIARKALTVTPQQPPRQIIVRTPASAALHLRRTPINATTRTPIVKSTGRPLRPARQGPPTTPHAIRALQQRRNATPGRQYDNRRRSGVQQRETPQGDLRALGKLMRARAPAPTIVKKEEMSSAQKQRPRKSIAFDEEEPLGPAPRLSMPLHDREDDSWSFGAAPRISAAYEPASDDEPTMRSVEAGRRALLDGPTRRLSDETLRGLRQNGIEVDEEDANVGGEDDEIEDVEEDELSFITGGEETGELRSLLNARRQSRNSGTYDLTASPGTDGEPTFVFRIPEQQRRRSTLGTVVRQADVDDDEAEDIASALSRPVSGNDDYILPTVEEENDTTTGAVQPDIEDESAGEATESDDEEEPVMHASRRMSDPQLQPRNAETDKEPANVTEPKAKFVSRHGTEYSSLPTPVIKRIASTIMRSQGSKARIDKDTLAALSQASDWFFEQVAEDLGAYARHAKRTTIDEADVVMLMKRQKQISAAMTPFALATKLLPRELVKDIKMPVVPKSKAIGGKKRKKLEAIHEDEEED